MNTPCISVNEVEQLDLHAGDQLGGAYDGGWALILTIHADQEVIEKCIDDQGIHIAINRDIVEKLIPLLHLFLEETK